MLVVVLVEMEGELDRADERTGDSRETAAEEAVKLGEEGVAIVVTVSAGTGDSGEVVVVVVVLDLVTDETSEADTSVGVVEVLVREGQVKKCVSLQEQLGP